MDPAEGLGCWGVVWYAARYYGYDFPRFEEYIDGVCQELDVAHHRFEGLFDKVDAAQPGDVVTLSVRCDGVTDHIGIAISGSHFLHSTPHGGVVLSRMTSPVYKRRITGIYRWKKQQQNT